MTANPAESPTAGLLMIGNEILSGKIEDANAPYLCRELRFLGVDVRRILTIPDEFDLIGRSAREFSEVFSWVFTSGGIGPTHDDLTIPAIAAGFGVKAVTEPRLEAAVRAHYRGRLTDAHLRMALVPEGAELIDIKDSGHPQVRFRNVFILPGVPELFRHRFNAIKSLFHSDPITLHEIFLKADEGKIAEVLGDCAQCHPDVLIGSYPSFFRDDYSLKLTLEGRDAETVKAVWADLRGRLDEVSAVVVKVT